MAFDFPSSPSVGQEYSSGAAVYVWNGYGWRVGPRETSTPPTTTVSDDFNRGSLGSNWTTPSGFNALTIASNHVVGSTASAHNVGYYNVAPLPNDQWVQATVVTAALY